MIRFEKYLNKNQLFFHIFISVVILFSSWTIYYRLPSPNLFYAMSVCFILIQSDFSFEKSKLIFSSLFGIIIFRYFIPLDVSLFEKTFYTSIVQIAFLIALLLLSDENRFYIYQKFIRLFTFIVGVGLIFHIFCILGFPLLSPFTTHISSTYRVFIVYLTHSNLIVHGVEEIYRYSSIFDEAGYLGTLIAFILAIERYNFGILRNKILFLVGIFTFSASFFFLSLIFITFHMVNIKNIKKYFKTIIFVLSVVAVIYFFLPHIFDVFTSRLIFNPHEGFQDNRLNILSFKRYIDYVSNMDINIFLWGLGRFALPEDIGISMDHVSWLHLLIRIGVVLFIYMILLLFWVSIKSKNYYVFTFIVIFLVSVNYRPQIFNPIYVFILSCGLYQKKLQENSVINESS